MRSFWRLQLSFLLDFLSRKLGRKSRFLETPGVPQSHFYPSGSLTQALSSVSEDFLLYSGWRNSRTQMRSVDRIGRSVPWLTYPSIAFLEQLDFEDKTVLEFGGGASTDYFSRRSKDVITIELDRLYLDSLRKLNLGNVTFFEWPTSPPSSKK